MSLPYTSADFTTPRAGGESFIEYPFIEDGDNATKVYHLKCSVNKDDYAAIALDVTMASAANADVLSLPFAADAAAYCVGDYNHRVTDGVLMTFDRQFANIPAAREEYSGTASFNFPGLPSSPGDAAINVTSASYSDPVTTYNTATAHGMTAGSIFRLWFEGTGGTSTLRGYSFEVCISGTTGSVIKTNSIVGYYSLTSATVYPNATQGRDPTNLISPTFQEFDYFLPGVSANITTPADIDLPNKFSPFIVSTGKYLGFLGINTTPTADEYYSSISNNEYLNMMAAVNRWKGNIYAREVTKIAAK